MTDQAPSVEEGSRRALLHRAAAGLAAGTALTLTGCSSQTVRRPRLSDGARRLDLKLFNRLLDIERESIAGYTAGIPLLTGRVAKAANQFLDDELAHAGELSALIARHGGKPDKPKPGYDLGSPRSHDEVLQLFHVLERRQIGAYRQAIALVTPGAARAALGSILGSDAQHVALLRSAVGEPPLVSPFVTGTE